MKKILICMLLLSSNVFGQNTFPSSGNVGIGTTSPQTQFHLVGDATINGDLSIKNYKNILGGFGAISTSGIQDWNDISVAKSGNSYSLLTPSALNSPQPGYYHSFTYEYGTKSGVGNLTQFAIPYYSETANKGYYYRTRYSNAYTPWMRILTENTSGNVGLGNVSPLAKLHVTQNGTNYGLMVDGGTNPIMVATDGTGITKLQQITGGIGLVGTQTNTDFGIYTNNQRQVIITKEGLVGFGTNSPGKNFEIKGSNGVGLRIFNSAANYWDISNSEFGKLDFTRANVLHMRIDQVGKIGIGTDSPAYRLDVKSAASDKAAIQVLYAGNQGDNAQIRYFNGYTQRWLTGMSGTSALGRDFVISEESSGRSFRFTDDGDLNIENGGLNTSGNVSIGFASGLTFPSTYKLAVDGNIIAEKVKVKNSQVWPDYVFEPTYSLLPLEEVAKYIFTNKHLPEIPSAHEIEKEGQDLGEMNRLLLKKVEELTLYLLNEHQSNVLLKKEVEELKSILKGK